MYNTLFALSLLLPAALFFLVPGSSAVNPSYGGVTVNLDGTLNCPSSDPSKKSYCAGDSNSTDFIIYCRDDLVTISACSLDLISIEPVGVKYGAACHQESAESGDAICVYEGKPYDTYDWKLPTTAETATGTQGRPEPTSIEQEIADYIMEGIRQHGAD